MAFGVGRHDRRGRRDRLPQSQRYPRCYDGNGGQFVAGLRDCRVGLVESHGDLAANVPCAAVIVLFVGQGIVEAAGTENEA